MIKSVPRMNEAESSAWLSLVQLLQLLPSALDSQLERDAGMTHFEYVLLSMLRNEAGGALQMKEIAQRTDATLPRLSRVVSRLEARGLVARTAAERSKRATDVALTSDGRRAVVRATTKHLELVRRVIIDPLLPTQLPALTEIASAITAELRAARAL